MHRATPHRARRARRVVVATTTALAVGATLAFVPLSAASAAQPSEVSLKISSRGPLVKDKDGTVTETSPIVVYPEPTTSPTTEPTTSPTTEPTTSPTTSPTTEPTTSPTPSGPYRAFTSTSPWNRQLPSDAPRHPDSDRIISYIKANNVNSGCVLLSGTGTNQWGTPVYWADKDDPTYKIPTSRYYLPPEFQSLRIPRGAKPMAADDKEMTVYDLEKGYVAWLYEAVYNSTTDTWAASGGSIAYLGSNGVLGSLTGSDDKRNTGSHRGLNGAIVNLRYDEVKSGAIRHAVRIGVKGASTKHTWPMAGSDGRSTDPYAPWQGARLRIKPGVDLSRYNLHPDALVIARGLQQYGAVVGDSTGAPVELKLEDTVQQGRGQLWTLSQYAMCSIPVEALEVLSHDFR